MILQELVKYYDRIPIGDIAPMGYSIQQIGFIVTLERDGKLFDIRLADQDEKGKPRSRRLMVPGQSKPPGQGINPCLFWDNAAYMLGLPPEGHDLEWTSRRFEAFRKRHLEIEKQIDDPFFSAVCRFLESWSPEQAIQREGLGDVAVNFGTFQLRGETGYLYQQESVRNWWQVRQDQLEAVDGKIGQCLVTGEEEVSLARLHEPAIKGVIDGQPAGGKIVSFNCKAFESYGKSQSFNAPVSKLAAFKYANALNNLLSDKKRRIQIGNTTVVFWTEQPSSLEDVWGAVADSYATEDEVLLKSIEDRLRRMQVGDGPSQYMVKPQTKFYILGLSSNNSRISVRWWYETTIGEMEHRLVDYVRSQEMAEVYGRPMGVKQLVAQTLRRNKKGEMDWDSFPDNMAGATLHSVLMGLPFPRGFLQSLIRRMGRCSPIDPRQAAAIRAYLHSTGDFSVNAYVDKLHPSPAYHAGRLFETLRYTQKEAIKSDGATIDKKYLSATCACPSMYLGMLQRHALQGHLRKLGSSISEFIIDEIRSINCTVNGDWPGRLGLVDQSKFMMGYHHQAAYIKSMNPGGNHTVRTKSGQWVRSKGERNVADALSILEIDYVYEPRAILEGGQERFPDFVIVGDKDGGSVYIEYLGMVDKKYDDRWNRKVIEYANKGITEDGGLGGRLIVIDDRESVSDQVKICEILKSKLNNI